MSRPPAVLLLYPVLLAVLPLAGSSAVAVAVLRHEAWLAQAPVLFWGLFFLAAAVTMAFALTPTTFVALLGGFLLGWPALPPLAASYLAAAWLGYRAAARLDGGRLLPMLARRRGVAAFLERLQSRSGRVVVLARLSPVLPFAVMNAVFAWVRVPVGPFLAGSLAGMLPRTVLAVWAGTQAGQLRALLQDPEGGGVWRLALLGLAVLSLAGLGYVLKTPAAPPPAPPKEKPHPRPLSKGEGGK